MSVTTVTLKHIFWGRYKRLMNKAIAIFRDHLLASAGAQPPSAVMIFPPPGDVTALDGREFKLGGYEALIETFKADGKDLPIDINHASEIKAPKGEESPAVGWIKDLYIKDDALWAVVEWTDNGRWMIENGDYKYVSPAWLVDKKTSLPSKLSSLALVNSPALDLPALARRQDDFTPPLSPQETIMNEEQLKALAEALGLKADAAPEAILAAAKKTTSPPAPAGEMVPVADYKLAMARADKLEAALTAAQEKADQDEAEALVDEACEAGKIAPASRDFWLNACKAQGVAAVRAHFEGTSAMEMTKAAETPPEPGDTKTLAAHEAPIAKALGMSAEDWHGENK